MTSAEFVEYVELFHREDKEKFEKKEKWEFYAAAIIAEQRRTWVVKKSAVKDEDFLLRYVSSEKKENPTPISQEEKEKRELSVEKYSWGIISGKAVPKSKKKVKKNGTNPHPPKSSRKVES